MKIAIDCGHGSNTAGKRTPPFPYEVKRGNIHVKKGEQYREHYANVGVAAELEKELIRCGFDVLRSAWDDEISTDDEDIALGERQKAIAKADCDYSISIHFNAFGDGMTFNDAHGVGIYIHNRNINQSEKLAKVVQKHLVGVANQKDRGVTKESWAMCNCNNLDVKGAILLELAFMTNLKEASTYMTDEIYWKKYAVAVARGLCEYTGIKYIAEQVVKTPTKTITVNSSKEDIMWAQERLNKLMPSYIPKLVVNGIYDAKMRIAVLTYWDSLGWAKHMRDDGTRIGSSTIKALESNRTK